MKAFVFFDRKDGSPAGARLELISAAAAIGARFVRSRLPPHPKRHFTLPFAPSFMAESTFISASGVCA